MKIICVGKNYEEHAREMGGTAPTDPVIFMKPETAYLKNGHIFYFPDFSSDVHYETELVIRINKAGKNIQERFASNYYDDITVGIDFTARDLQKKFKDAGHPWELSKGFDWSAPVGNFIPLNELPEKDQISFRLEINGNLAQQGSSKDMIHSFDKIVSYVSTFITLKKGDLIFTGTPAGVGPVKKDDRLMAFLENKQVLKITVK